MNEYDVIVIGSGAGMLIAEGALSQDLNVALVDKGPLGGTCLNLGCIPSKLLIYPADRLAEIQEADKLGISAQITHVDFAAIMDRMRSTVQEGQEHMRHGITHTQNLDFYEAEAHFTDEYTLDVQGKSLKGEQIFIACGARPTIPSVKGIESIEYLTNESVLELQTLPKSMIIIGGGYIAAEYGHFFAAMGTAVTIVQRRDRLVPTEEPEVADLLTMKLAKRMTIALNTSVMEVKRTATGYTVSGTDKVTGEVKEFTAGQIMIATGRRSNAGILRVEQTGVATDARGFITVNEYLETSKENIWAFGDVIGKQMFRHVANREALVAWHNSNAAEVGERVKMDYRAIPHAVFSHPQIASVGLTEAAAKQEGRTILVGHAHYADIAIGEAMQEHEGFAKAIVDKQTKKILGFHIIGPQAPTLIQEVINAMANGQAYLTLGRGIHIHPALPELILVTLQNLREV